jgi:hypothetical protein
VQLQSALDAKFKPTAIEQRIASLRWCLQDELNKRQSGDVAASENTLTERRVFYALQKLTGEGVGRERALQMAFEVLPQSTLLDALPPTLVLGIVGRTEQDLADAIQALYDIETWLDAQATAQLAAYISLTKSLQADIVYNLDLGNLVRTAAGAVTTKQGQTLEVELEMDACRAPGAERCQKYSKRR